MSTSRRGSATAPMSRRVDREALVAVVARYRLESEPVVVHLRQLRGVVTACGRQCSNWRVRWEAVIDLGAPDLCPSCRSLAWTSHPVPTQSGGGNR